MMNIPNSIEEFKAVCEEIQLSKGYRAPLAFGLGMKRSREDKTLDVLFPHLNIHANQNSAAILSQFGKETTTSDSLSIREFKVDDLEGAYQSFKPFLNDGRKHKNIETILNLKNALADANTDYSENKIICLFLYDLNSPVKLAEEAYFKLQLLSQRLIKPHEANLDGAFGALNNIAWTNYGPILPEDVEELRIKTQFSNRPLQVSHLDKFPYLLDYTIPSGVRVTARARARLGAHLGEGTTIMPAGYVNFNAGSLGKAMIEGRVSGGVVIDDGTDIGGGASILGTLSGGNKEVIKLGKNCLMGANSGTGISLGNGCLIEAGLYITAGMPVSLFNLENQPVNLEGKVTELGANIVKAKELSGRDNLLIIKNSQTGQLICKPNRKAIELNELLHAN